MLKAALDQRGRASIDFLAALAVSAGKLRQEVDADIAAAGVTAETLPDDLDERLAVMDEALAGSKAHRVRQLVGDWHSRAHGAIAIEAFEDSKDKVMPTIDRLDNANGPAELHLNPDFTAPKWWSDHWIHRSTGGWDGHKYMGFVHGEIIHRLMVEKMYPGGIFRQRRMIAEKAPRDDYKDILEMGTSSGHFTVGLQEAYPDAQITGVDLSPRMLEQAYRVANERGWGWKLYERDATDTRFADESFDLVASYIMLHEMPAEAVKASFREAFRVLRPGGDILFIDVTRYADMDKLAVWRADYGAVYGGEPFWRESASLDLAEVAREAGFEDVKAVSEAPMNYPHYVLGRKPA